MFCPNCGATNSTEQKLCRACGLKLSAITEQVLRHYDDSFIKLNWLKRMGFFTIGVAGGIIITLLFMSLARDIFRFSDDAVLKFFVFLAIILWGFIAMVIFDRQVFKQKKLSKQENKDNY